jgi:hypothetical protein
MYSRNAMYSIDTFFRTILISSLIVKGLKLRIWEYGNVFKKINCDVV